MYEMFNAQRIWIAWQTIDILFELNNDCLSYSHRINLCKLELDLNDEMEANKRLVNVKSEILLQININKISNGFDMVLVGQIRSNKLIQHIY